MDLKTILGICARGWKKRHGKVIACQSEQGTSLARRRGVELAQGKYITFSDQDDNYISRFSIEEMYN